MFFCYKIEYGEKIVPRGSCGFAREYKVVVAPDAESAARQFKAIMPKTIIHEIEAQSIGSIYSAEGVDSVAPECFETMATDLSDEEREQHDGPGLEVQTEAQ